MPNTVLLTRPASHNHELERALEEAGWHVTACPLTQIHPLLEATSKAPKEALDVLFFSSANAVRCCPEWPQAASPKTLVHAMGPATARALRARGWPVHWQAPAGSDGQSIQAHLKQDVPPVQHACLITGRKGKPWLANSLKSHHQRLSHWEVYERHCPNRWRFVVPEPTQVVLFFNGEAIRHWGHLMAGSRWRSWAPECFVVTSAAQAALAQQLPWMPSWVQAADPSVGSVVAALKAWTTGKES